MECTTHEETTCQDTDLGFSTTAQATYLLLNNSPAVSKVRKTQEVVAMVGLILPLYGPEGSSNGNFGAV
jgi:hypothetical protein